jgi:RNA-directed DNA polymerase
MKRKGNIYNDMVTMDNLHEAYLRARKGKSKQKGVIEFELNLEPNLLQLYNELINKTYRTSAYINFIIRDPKVRKISSLPFRDRIVHHLVMIQLEALFVSTFTTDTYACIKNRGGHKAKEALTRHLKNIEETTFCLKMDVKQFYPSVKHHILKALLRKKIKDNDLLQLLDEIIDSAPGLPIGNYLSQYFANFYLCYLDHVIKERFGVKRYCRYADDMVITDGDIKYLHAIRVLIEEYLWCELGLELKSNYQVFPIGATKGRLVDFAGYPQDHNHIRIRKKSKQKFARAMTGFPNRESIQACHGWAKHANTIHLLKKIKYYEYSIQRFGDKIKKPDRPKDFNRRNIGQENRYPGLQNWG